VEKIFQKLTLTFGRDFTSRWEGIPLDEVKADWAHELRGFQQNPQAIAYGIEHCISGKPPTVQEFKTVCLRRQDAFVALPGPAINKELADTVIAKLKSPKHQNDMKDWARILKTRHEAGEKLSLYQVKCYETALGAV